MAAVLADKRASDAAFQHLTASLGQHVLQRLGQPDVFHRVQVRALWEDHYRVNVLVGAEITSIKIAHSYFLVTDRDGKVLATTPEITRRS